MINKPYKLANRNSIAQLFRANPGLYWQPNGHPGVDFMGVYGTFLVAPELCDVTNVIDNTAKLDTDLAPLERGYGIMMRSVASPNVYYLYWHCLPVFPVKIGDRVKPQQIVAQMGNSGFCVSRGEIVPLDIRLIPPYTGTHLHAERREYNSDGTFKYTDILQYIDWNLPVTYDPLTAIKEILSKIMNILK